MRIAHVSTVHLATDNRIAAKECTALAQAGHEVTLIAAAGQGDSHRSLFRHIEIPRAQSRVARVAKGYLSVWRALKRVRPHVVHIHDPELIPLAVVWSRLHRSLAVYDAHEDLPMQIAQAKQYIPTWARAGAQRVGQLLESLADHGCAAVVIANPSCLSKYTNRRRTLVQNFPWLRQFPEPAPYSHSEGALAYVGSVSRSRGSARMLRLLDAIPEISLTIAGPVSDTSTASDLHAREDSSATSPARLRNLGPVPPEQIPAILAQASAGLALLSPLPNYLRAQSTKLYEYMAAGRPFICSDLPHWRAQLDELNAGWFVDPDDDTAVAAAVRECLEDPEQAAAMGARGRQAVTERFCFEVEARALTELYSDLESAWQDQHGREHVGADRALAAAPTGDNLDHAGGHRP